MSGQHGAPGDGAGPAGGAGRADLAGRGGRGGRVGRVGRELDLLVIGDCNPDVLILGDDVTPAFGQQEKIVGGISLVVGGSASITALAAARLGLRVALAATVGADPAGDFMLAQLTAAGVDCTPVVRRPDLATGMTVVLSQPADRAILTATGAMTALTAADIDGELLARTRHVHVSSYFLLEETLGPGLAGLLAAARSAGATTSLDTNWDPAGHWGGQQLRDVIAETYLLLPNEEEARQLGNLVPTASAPTHAGVLADMDTATPGSTADAAAPAAAAASADPAASDDGAAPASTADAASDAVPSADVSSSIAAAAAAADALRRLGPRVVVKLGAAGALIADESGPRRVAPPAAVLGFVVDTTGAGDCFNAGLITGLLRGLDLTDAARLGCAVGAASTRGAGGTAAAPTLADALALANLDTF